MIWQVSQCAWIAGDHHWCRLRSTNFFEVSSRHSPHCPSTIGLLETFVISKCRHTMWRFLHPLIIAFIGNIFTNLWCLFIQKRALLKDKIYKKEDNNTTDSCLFSRCEAIKLLRLVLLKKSKVIKLSKRYLRKSDLVLLFIMSRLLCALCFCVKALSYLLFIIRYRGNPEWLLFANRCLFQKNWTVCWDFPCFYHSTSIRTCPPLCSLQSKWKLLRMSC